jgi:cytochrome c-type biogenesis protein CcmH/NrfF
MLPLSVIQGFSPRIQLILLLLSALPLVIIVVGVGILGIRNLREYLKRDIIR